MPLSFRAAKFSFWELWLAFPLAPTTAGDVDKQDTFLLRDPTKRFEAAAQDWDALFARHGDGDCINIGIFYIKAGPGNYLKNRENKHQRWYDMTDCYLDSYIYRKL